MTAIDVKAKSTDDLRKLFMQVRDEIWEREYASTRLRNQELIGKCYKYRNSYGGDDHTWWVYSKVTGVDARGELRGFQFQDDGRGRFIVETERLPECLLENLIAPEEFKAAFEEFVERINVRKDQA